MNTRLVLSPRVSPQFVPWSTYMVLAAILLMSQVAGCQPSAAKSAISTSSSSSAAREWVFVIAPGSKLDSNFQKAFTEFLSRSAGEGDVVHFVNSLEHNVIESVVIPKGSPGVRLKKLAGSCRRLVAGWEDAPPSEPFSTSTGTQLNLPRLATSIAAIRRTATPLKIFLIGSILYHDPADLGWSMVPDRCPSAGALCLEGSGCPLRAQGRSFPADTEIFWWTAPDWGVSEPHRDAVRDSWRHFFSVRKATLKFVTTDFATLFYRASHPSSDSDWSRMVLTAAESEFNGMLRFGNRSESVVSEIPTEKVHEKPYSEPTKLSAPATTASSESQTALGAAELPDELQNSLQRDQWVIVAFWDSIERQHCDVDLYAKRKSDHEGSQEVSFRQPEIETIGQLYRDLRSASGLAVNLREYKQWEAIQLLPGLSLTEVDLCINIYQAEAPVEVKVIAFRITAIRSEQLVDHFTMDLRNGDASADSNRRSSSPYWRRIDFNIVP